MSQTIKVTENLSTLDGYASLDLSLWLTPGSDRPYWSNNANFKYDQRVATPYDFLEAAGYDCFNDDHDYSGNDEAITIKVDWIDPTSYTER
jgi:hypothetical protein